MKIGFRLFLTNADLSDQYSHPSIKKTANTHVYCQNFKYNKTGNYLLSRVVSNQVPWAWKRLTSVFGMGTGVPALLSSPALILLRSSNLQYCITSTFSWLHQFASWLSPRPISISQLNALPHLHTWPINLIVYKGSYSFLMGNLILRLASHLDAFSAYPSRT